ncbi:MAG: rhomboid family intramembrane serine protease [Flavisolibacter sp.]|nr:rhomboid family intramembrane serine protease [Flavisolibacter sp.]
MSDFRYTRPDSFPPVVKNLIIINVLVYLAQITMDNQFHITQKIALYPVMFPQFRAYQIATHMFAHSPSLYFHILFNMFALWMFGRVLENVWHGKRFLLFYFICGVGAAACHLAVQYFVWQHAQQLYAAGEIEQAKQIAASLGPALGASGAVMGILAAFAYLFPNTELFIFLIPIPIKAKWAVLGMVAFDLFGGLTNPNSGIAHFAHLGGAITGFILVFFWNKKDRHRFY